MTRNPLTQYATMIEADPLFFAGDVVVFDPKYAGPAYAGRVFQIQRVNPKTVVLIDQRGTRVKADRRTIVASDKPFVPDPTEAFHLGDTVEWAAGAGDGKVYVILNVDAAGLVRMTELNGGTDRWYRSVPPQNIRKVEVNR